MNEVALVEWIRKHAAAPRSRDLILGIGDDCAILRPRPNEDLLLKTDPLTQSAEVQELREVDEATYQADLLIRVQRRLTESKVKLRVEIRVRPSFWREQQKLFGDASCRWVLVSVWARRVWPWRASTTTR